MDRVKKTARKSCGQPPNRTSVGSPQPAQSSGDIEILDADEPRQLSNSNNSSSNINKPKLNNVNSSPMKASSEITPMELQIRQVELLEEQCDSLEKLVEIAAEYRDIQREILEVKKRKLAIMEKNSKEGFD